jgi:hypothetical protein
MCRRTKIRFLTSAATMYMLLCVDHVKCVSHQGIDCLFRNMSAESNKASFPVAVPGPLPQSAGKRRELYTRLVLLGGTSIAVGILWDISWHRTIGRDTFWTPAHMAIYFGGLLGGLTCGWLVLRTTFFGTAEDGAGSVGIWGFRGPLGAWVTIWGAFAMLTSAPFDNWWHDAYGVDVKILSPPHTVLALGMWGCVLGALFLLLREQNLAARPGVIGNDSGQTSRPLYIYASGVLVVMASVFLIEFSWPNQQRGAKFYEFSLGSFPFYLMLLSRGSKLRWAATWIALTYMGITAAMAWVLPLFPGQPRLGPIYNPVRHFVALPFPLLLVVPALGVDLLRRWIGHGRGWIRDWLLAISAGLVFFALFLVVQWYFSAFLISHRAENWFFAASNHWGYRESLGEWRNRYWERGITPFTPKAAAISLGLSILASRIGLWLGNWMAKVRR